MAGYQQDDTLSGGCSPLERLVNCMPRLIEGTTMEIQHPVRLDQTGSQPAIPSRIERCNGQILLASC